MSADKRKEMAERLSDEYDIGMDLVLMADAAMRDYAASVLEEAAKDIRRLVFPPQRKGYSAQYIQSTLADRLLARAAEERKG